MLLVLAAAAATPLEKLHNVSGQFWIKVILAFAVLALLIFIFKKAMGMNKIILIIIGCVVLGLVGFSWIYKRNEPAFLTPFIDSIAPFFPAEGAYEGKQKQDPSAPGIHKNAPATPATTPAQPTKK
jgi:hypothetical protein